MFSEIYFYCEIPGETASRAIVSGIKKQIIQNNAWSETFFSWGVWEDKDADINDGLFGSDDLVVEVLSGEAFELITTTTKKPRTAYFFVPGIDEGCEDIDWDVEVPKQFLNELSKLVQALTDEPDA